MHLVHDHVFPEDFVGINTSAEENNLAFTSFSRQINELDFEEILQQSIQTIVDIHQPLTLDMDVEPTVRIWEDISMDDDNDDDDAQLTDIAGLLGSSQNTPSVQIGVLVIGVCQFMVLEYLGDVHVNFHELYCNSPMLKDDDFKQLCTNMDLHFTKLPEELQCFLLLVIIPEDGFLTTDHWIPVSTLCQKYNSYLQTTKLHALSPSLASDIVIKIAIGDYTIRFPTVEEDNSGMEQYVNMANFSKMKCCNQDEDLSKLTALLLERELSNSVSDKTPIKQGFLKTVPETHGVAEIQNEINEAKESGGKKLVAGEGISLSCSLTTFESSVGKDCVEKDSSVPFHDDDSSVKSLLFPCEDNFHGTPDLVRSSIATAASSVVSKTDVFKQHQNNAIKPVLAGELSHLIAVLPEIPCEDFNLAACSTEFDGLLASLHKFEAFTIRNDHLCQDISQWKRNKEHDIPEQGNRGQNISTLQQQCKNGNLSSPSTNEKLPGAANITLTTMAGVSPSLADTSSGKFSKISLVSCGVCKNSCSCLGVKEKLCPAQDHLGDVQLDHLASVCNLPPAVQNQLTCASRMKSSLQTPSEAPTSNACAPGADAEILSGTITPSQQLSKTIGSQSIKAGSAGSQVSELHGIGQEIGYGSLDLNNSASAQNHIVHATCIGVSENLSSRSTMLADHERSAFKKEFSLTTITTKKSLCKKRKVLDQRADKKTVDRPAQVTSEEKRVGTESYSTDYHDSVAGKKSQRRRIQFLDVSISQEGAKMSPTETSVQRSSAKLHCNKSVQKGIIQKFDYVAGEKQTKHGDLAKTLKRLQDRTHRRQVDTCKNSKISTRTQQGVKVQNVGLVGVEYGKSDEIAASSCSASSTENHCVVDQQTALSKRLYKQTAEQMPPKDLDKSAGKATKDSRQASRHRTILKRVSSHSWKVVSQTSEADGPRQAQTPRTSNLRSDIHLVKKLLLKYLEVQLEKNSQQDLRFRLRPRSSFRKILKNAGLTWNHPHCRDLVSKVTPLLVAAVRWETQQIVDSDAGNT